MPGMGRSIETGNSLIVSTFRSTLFHQLLVVVGIALACLVAFNIVRTVQYRRLNAHGQHAFPSGAAAGGPEPAARRVVRIGFGLLWILDGLLQLQSSMPLGLPSSVVQPSAASSPAWVRHLVDSGATIWSNHPVQAASAVVWIQLGLGIWLLAASRGRWSRLAGAASVGWGLLVWVFGEAFGGIFAPGLTWLFGAPGAVLFYCVGGLLVALPERSFSTPRLGRIVLGAGGVFLIGMALLQAWPGRGYWQGRGGTLHAMVVEMAQTSQPGFLSSWLSSFADFDAAHGWAVNLFAVVSLATIGALLLTARRRLVFGALVALTVLGLADWILVEDLGVFGGVGTDPNSMLPMLLLFATGYVAVTWLPEERAQDTVSAEPDAAAGSAAGVVGAGHHSLPGALAGRARRTGCRARGDRAHGPGGREPERRSDPERGPRRDAEHDRRPGASLLADGSERPAGEPGQPAWPRRGADVPRPGVHLRLPLDRAGVPPDRREPRRSAAATSISSPSSPTRSTARSPTPTPSIARRA